MGVPDLGAWAWLASLECSLHSPTLAHAALLSVCLDHGSRVQSSVDGHLEMLALALVNNSAMNICVHVFAGVFNCLDHVLWLICSFNFRVANDGLKILNGQIPEISRF